MTNTPRHRDLSTAALALGWGVVAAVARAPLVIRIEGALDHDQSVVGLMALDIAAGRRFPLFFDGQRYMGALEAYVAAAFVRVLGHAPEVVALAPLLAFAAFAAGQFAVWSDWRGRTTGHLAAALTVIGSPMLGLWGVVPRGGYVEFLAWALPTLWAYRTVARPSRPVPARWRQAAWGFWLALGYFLNPLSLTVYATIALDWALGRHGAELRGERRFGVDRLKGPAAPAWWIATALGFVTALAACCHVDPHAAAGGSPYVACGGALRGPWAVGAGAAGVVGLLAIAAWWTGGPARLSRCLRDQPWVVAGILVAWSPFVAFGWLVRAGVYPPAPSLPVWIGAPWKAGPNAWTAVRALGPLAGCDPRALETVFVGQGILPPEPRWPLAVEALLGLTPAVVAVAVGLVVAAAVRDRGRSSWSEFFGLRGTDVAPPCGLALGFLGVTVGLFLLQGTSPNASSVRYLVPTWVALPGLLACGLRAVPVRVGWPAGAALVVPWAAAQGLIWTDMGRPTPARPLAVELAHRGVPAIVAPTPVALVVANLTHGAVGAVEYQPIWPRLGDRYRNRFPAGRPVVCVTDRQFPWAIRGEGSWSPAQDLERHLRGLAARHPGRVRTTWTVGPFDVWEVDLPLDAVLVPPADPAPTGLAAVGR